MKIYLEADNGVMTTGQELDKVRLSGFFSSAFAVYSIQYSFGVEGRKLY